MKRVLKLIGISLLVVLTVIIAGVIIVAIQGGWSSNKKQVDSLTILVNGEESGEVLVDQDFSVQLNYSPADAQVLDVSVSANTYGESVLSSVPSKVIAGTPFTIKLAKDENGNNKGGEADIVFESSNKIVRRTLKVMVDVELKDGDLVYSNYSSGISYNDSKSRYETIVSPTITSNMTLTSTLAHAVNPATGLSTPFVGDLKNITHKKAYVFSDTYGLQGLSVEGSTASTYSVSVRARQSARQVNLSTYVHRLYRIQNAFNDAWFTQIMSMTSDSTFASAPDYNAFLNQYLSYFTQTQEASEFFETVKQDVTRVVGEEEVTTREVLIEANDFENLQESLRYVLVKATAPFAVENVQIGRIDVASQLSVSALSPQTSSIQNIYANWNVALIPDSHYDTELNRQVLQASLANLNIGTYVQCANDPDEEDDDYYDVITVGSHTIPKYIEINDVWYVYDTSMAGVNKIEDGENTLWTIEPYYPNYNDSTLINNGKQLFLFYFIINEDIDGVQTLHISMSELRVIYHSPTLQFSSNQNTTQEIIVTNIKDSTGQYYTPYYGYSVNTSKGVSTTDVEESAGQNIGEYQKIVWFIEASSNSANIVAIPDLEGNSSFDGINNFVINNNNGGVYLTNVDGTAFLDNKRWLCLGDDETCVIEAINALAVKNGLNGKSGVKLYAMRVMTDLEGNLITTTRTIGLTQEETLIVVSYTNSPINYVTTYMFTKNDNLYLYYYDEDESQYVKYENYRYQESINGEYVQLDNGDYVLYDASDEAHAERVRYTQILNVLEYHINDNIKLIVTPFELDDLDTTPRAVSTNSNTGIALYNYYDKLVRDGASYISLTSSQDSGLSSEILSSPTIGSRNEGSIDYFEIQFRATQASLVNFTLNMAVMLATNQGNTMYEGFGVATSNLHSNLSVELNVA